jgi:acyl-CoA synthetase (AMP-forming)/AMP-acid ligase II
VVDDRASLVDQIGRRLSGPRQVVRTLDGAAVAEIEWGALIERGVAIAQRLQRSLCSAGGRVALYGEPSHELVATISG